jgi:hypothetical protein
MWWEEAWNKFIKQKRLTWIMSYEISCVNTLLNSTIEKIITYMDYAELDEYENDLIVNIVEMSLILGTGQEVLIKIECFKEGDMNLYNKTKCGHEKELLREIYDFVYNNKSQILSK